MNSSLALPHQRHRSAPLWLLALTMVLVVGAWSAWNAYVDYRQTLEQQYRLLEVRARQREASISGSLRSVNLMLGSIIDDLNDHPAMSVAEQSRLLKGYMRQLPELRNLLIEDAAGIIRAEANQGSIGADASNREYFKHHRAAPDADGFFFSRPFKAFSGVTTTTLSRARRDSQGRFGGVVLASLDSGFFNGALKFSVPEPGLEAYLINLQGDVISAVPRGEHVGKNLQGGIAYTEHMNSGRATTRHLNKVKLDPVVKISLFHNLPAAPLAVIVARDFDDVMAEWERSLYSHIAGFVLLAATALFFSWLAARRQQSLVRAQEQIGERELELRTIIETEPECVKQLAADGTLLHMNRAGLDMIEADSLDQVRGQKVQQIVTPEYREAFTRLNRRVFKGETGELVFEIIGLKGGHRWLETHAVPLRNAQGEVTALLGLTRDITERRRAEEALKESERKLSAILENVDAYIYLKDTAGRYLFANRPVRELFGKSMEEIVGRGDEAFFDAETAVRLRDNDRPVLEDGETLRTEETNSNLRDGSTATYLSVKLPLRNEAGEIYALCGISTDITDRKQMEDQVRQLAFHDALTKLPNRRLLNDRLGQTIAANKRSGCYGALMFLDLDNFKPLNDVHGHDVGDLLLIEAADRLKRCVREMDTVARFGGDEFVVMISELDADKTESATQAGVIAEKIRSALSEPYRLTREQEGKADVVIEHRCTASIGVALFIDSQTGQDDILKWADMAMYQAKAAGRNTIRFFDSSPRPAG